MAADWRVFVGRSWWGKPIHYNLRGRTPHVSIAGATGSGKSEFLKLLLYSACQKQDERNLEIHIIDLKGGATFSAWKHALQVKDIYRTTAEALGCLMAIEEGMWRRLDIINQARYAFRPDPWFKEIFVAIDEGGELSPEGAYGNEKQLRTACMHILSTLVRIGREPGVHIIHATQRPDADTLPTTIRSQLETRFCFRVAEDLDSRIVLRHNGAEDIPLIPGRMIMQTPNSEQLVQAAYVSPSQVITWLQSYKVATPYGAGTTLS
ncbi:DUF87 domain-containing protein (plasmid) [Alicyclobacillus curvatus]|nr:DUF87 domain-containing protein [Alicyclobacillus curvatus]